MTRREKKMQTNGLHLELLQGAMDVIREQPEAGIVTIRTLHCWDDGFGVDGYAKEVEEGGEVTARRFTFRADWPPEVGGRDRGPAPGEVLLGALGGCVTMTYITKAALRGVTIDKLEVMIEARVDLQGTFGSTPCAPVCPISRLPWACDQMPTT
jgi:hypothetical protein